MNPSLSHVAAISIGASLGALGRWQLGLWLNPPQGIAYSFPGVLPWGTFWANVLGGFLIGVCVGVLQALPDLHPVWRLALITGFLGGLTTFSTFSYEVVSMLLRQQYGLAVLVTGAHLLGSLVATVLGLQTVRLFQVGLA